MTNAHFTKLCRDIEKVSAKYTDGNGNKPIPIMGGLSTLTDEELEERLLGYFEQKYNLTRDDIVKRLESPHTE